MTNKYLISAICLLLSLPCAAKSVLFSENFNNDYSENFPTLIDLDGKAPVANVLSLFMNESGVAMPWWHLKDVSASNDRFLGSHSIYNPVGASNDWVCSRAVTIPTTGFNLYFGAQSLPFRTGDIRLSDLYVFITETPVSKTWQPEKSDAALFIEKVPFGEKLTDAEGDFIPYSINLDEYVGKTIYVSFANLNDNADLLLIDDVEISRDDDVELAVSAEKMVVFGDINIAAEITANRNVTGWTLSYSDSEGYSWSESGDALSVGENRSFQIPVTAAADKVVDYTVTISYNEGLPVVSNGTFTSLAFKPFRGILIEEATGLWCGNCPTGIYNMEMLSENEETREYAIPVSVHVPGSGNDFLVNPNYAGLFGVTVAPAYRINRDPVVRTFSTALDVNFNPDTENSMANMVRKAHNTLTILDIDLEASFRDSDKEVINVKASVNPALSVDASDLRIGFIVKENNVDSSNSILMIQHNYTSGQSANLGSTLGGWTEMPQMVPNAKFHDVARAIWNYRGIEKSMPEKLEVGTTHEYQTSLTLPDTYYAEEYNGIMMVGSPQIIPDNLYVVAFVYDNKAGEILNAVQVPMSEAATVRDNSFLSTNGVDSIISDSETDAPVIYYDLQGRRVQNPTSGLYIMTRGSETSKIYIK